MRHLKDSKKFNKSASHRKAMFRNMVTSFLRFERITTTLQRAKELRRHAERMITLGKKGDLGSRRRALGFVQDKDVVQKMFDGLAKRYADRKGGYTRIFKTAHRHGDAAQMAIIELVDRDPEAQEKRRVKRAKEEEQAPAPVAAAGK